MVFLNRAGKVFIDHGFYEKEMATIQCQTWILGFRTIGKGLKVYAV
jgi:hypothetical protein